MTKCGKIYSQCTKKKGYTTTSDANAMIHTLKRDSRNRHIDFRYYRCPFCGKYHLTKQKPN